MEGGFLSAEQPAPGLSADARRPAFAEQVPSTAKQLAQIRLSRFQDSLFSDGGHRFVQQACPPKPRVLEERGLRARQCRTSALDTASLPGAIMHVLTICKPSLLPYNRCPAFARVARAAVQGAQ